jgi:hypothetical protein
MMNAEMHEKCAINHVLPPPFMPWRRARLIMFGIHINFRNDSGTSSQADTASNQKLNKFKVNQSCLASMRSRQFVLRRLRSVLTVAL